MRALATCFPYPYVLLPSCFPNECNALTAKLVPAVFLRTYTIDAAKQIPDDSLDFIYVDAR
jgi:hypothetical protein